LAFHRYVGTFFLVGSILVGLGFAIYQQNGAVLPEYFVVSPLGIWFFFSLSLLFVSWTTTLTVRELKSALTTAKEQNKERVKAESTLRASETMYRLLVENVTDVVWQISPDLKYTYSSPTDERQRGYKPEEVLGRSIFDFMTPQSKLAVKALASARQERVKQGLSLEAATYEIEQIRKEGSLIWTEVTSNPVYDENGNLLYFQGITRDITERKQAENALRYMSTHDTMTGTFNRAFFETELTRLEHGREYPVSLVVTDLDNMKVTNDHFGHPAGDELLRNLADILRETFRAEDIIARIGGDEFAVLLPSTDATAANRMLERVSDRLNEYNAVHPELPILLSIGTATASYEHLMNTFSLADQRMYANKAVRKSKGQ
jgi:diguanylate cyclase (GGDEF)-like protein/PAS domain S-box-containing protein